MSSATSHYPRPINTTQLELLTIISKAINDGCGTPREIFDIAPLWAVRDGFDKLMKAICILVDRGVLMPMDNFRPDTYLSLTNYGGWLLGQCPQPKAARKPLAYYIQGERGYNERIA